MPRGITRHSEKADAERPERDKARETRLRQSMVVFTGGSRDESFSPISFPDLKSYRSQPHDFIAIEDPTRAPNGVPGLRAVCLGCLHAGADSFTNQLPLKLRNGREDVHQELARWVGFVRKLQIHLKRKDDNDAEQPALGGPIN